MGLIRRVSVELLARARYEEDREKRMHSSSPTRTPANTQEARVCASNRCATRSRETYRI